MKALEMPLIAKSSNSDNQRPLPPSGTHVARCVQLIDLGTHEVDFAGKKKTQHKIRLAWELPTEKTIFDASKGEEPFMVSKEYTLSLFRESNLRRDLEGWRGEAWSEEEFEFDISKVLGKPCMISIIHAEKKAGGKYAKVASVAALPKSVVCPNAIISPLEYNLAMGKNEVFQGLPEWIRNTISKCSEWQQPPPTADPTPAEEDGSAGDEQVPF